ncbi:MAG TPA: TolC family protein [Thermoanaerobaculia bacterium]|nr:TolC family protein [Thermoanaerobaculia bacterium]
MTSKRFAAVLALALLALPPRVVDGQETRFRSSWKASDPAAELTVRDSTIALSLDDAVAIALSQNLGLRIERFQRARALFQIQQELGIYDLALSADAFSSSETTPAVSSLEGAQQQMRENQGLNVGFDQLVPIGGVASINWTNGRAETNSLFADINPSFNVGFDVLYSQPLLQSFGRLVTNRNLRVAEINSEVSVEDLEIAIAETIQQVENAYWSLVEARQQLAVDEESTALANQLHEMNRIQVDVGTKAPLELIQSEVGIATRQEQIIRSQAAVEDSADELRRLLNLEGEQLWTASIEPVTDPETSRLEIDLEQSLRTAIDERPEVASQRLFLETLELDERVFRKQKLPVLDLQLRYGYNGVGGDRRIREDPDDIFNPDPEFTIVPGGIDDAFQQIVDRESDGWQVALNLRYPIQNRTARARATGASLALEQGRTQLEDLLLSVRTEVRTAARGVQTAAQQIDSAGKSRELAERNLDAEQKRYENGLSTSFQVLEIQEDLSLARSREVSAVTAYRRALVAYYRAIGLLLEENGVVIEDEQDFLELQP